MPIHVTTSTIQSLSNKTFVDLLSTTGVVYANQGNSNQWSSSYSTVAAQSASNASVFAIVQANSASNWNYQGTDIKALTGAWQNTYTTLNAQSGNNASVFTTVQVNSAAWDTGGSTIDADVRALTANWQSTYSTVQTNSATTWNYQGTDIKALTANWQSTYTTVQSNSANWNIQPLRVSVPFSDQTSNLTTGTKYTFTWRYGSSTLSATPVDLVEAPTGSSFVINVTKNASSIYSVKPSIDVGETSTDTATTVAVITATSFSNGDIVAVSIDQVGVSNTGKGAIITFVGTTIV